MILSKKQLILAKNIMVLALVVFLMEFAFPAQLLAAETDNLFASGPALLSLSDGIPGNEILAFKDNMTIRPKQVRFVTITAYSSTVDQCDSTPFITAHNTSVRDGIIAANFLPFHTKVKIPELFGNKVFEVEDRMNQKYSDRVDIWMESREEAIHFGAKFLKIEVYDSGVAVATLTQ
jgi:3D (Asp-Asp-Asp) domain-containing protein